MIMSCKDCIAFWIHVGKETLFCFIKTELYCFMLVGPCRKTELFCFTFCENWTTSLYPCTDRMADPESRHNKRIFSRTFVYLEKTLKVAQSNSEKRWDTLIKKWKSEGLGVHQVAFLTLTSVGFFWQASLYYWGAIWTGKLINFQSKA